MQKCDFSFIEITHLPGYASVNMLHSSRMSFLENTTGELLLYIVLNIEVINVKVLPKQVKSCLKYISVLKTPCLTSFAWWPKISLQKP